MSNFEAPKPIAAGKAKSMALYKHEENMKGAVAKALVENPGVDTEVANRWMTESLERASSTGEIDFPDEPFVRMAVNAAIMKAAEVGMTKDSYDFNVLEQAFEMQIITMPTPR